MRKYIAIVISMLLSLLTGCGGGGGNNDNPPPPPAQFTFSLSAATLTIFQTGTPGSVNITVARNGASGSLGLAVSGLPSGATAQTTGLGTTSAGSLTIDAGSASAGNYDLLLTLSDGHANATQSLALVIGAKTTLTNVVTGRLDLAMSTSFQPAEWNYQFFSTFPNATTPLDDLGSQHIRLQPVSQSVPQTSPTTWDFSTLDAVVNPVFTTADHSPQFQIAVAPAFMYDINHKLSDLTYQQFANYSAQLVRYYNTGGFDAPDGHHASKAGYPITYWGIFNEPNINNLSPDGYVALYNRTVPAMQAVDANLKFVAIELSDWGPENTRYIPPFVNNVTAQVDVMATHFYSTCNQLDSDQQLFNTIPDFANRVTYLYSEMATNPNLANVPVWITENNVNADWDKGGGISQCNGTPFVIDQRGSSAYFAAWRPYMFSQVGKVGARALYNWLFAGDAQYGELNDQTGNPRLSYWVDYWLGHYFPSPPGADLLQFSTTDVAGVETLAAKNPDGSIVVMVANHAVKSSGDNNGNGAPRSVALDVHALTTSTTAKLLMIDGNTDPVNGPSETPILLTPETEIDFSGYGVAFLTFK